LTDVLIVTNNNGFAFKGVRTIALKKVQTEEKPGDNHSFERPAFFMIRMTITTSSTSL
jgi:hypothetical protein